MASVLAALRVNERLRGLGGEDVERGAVSGSGECHRDGCEECDTGSCMCNCCQRKRAEASSQQLAARQELSISTSRAPGASFPSAERQTFHQQHTTSSSANVLPIIIAPVALVIVVICVMIYFRIRPFHRSNDCVDVNYMSREVTKR
ncbi:hypothetical protein BBBOND_0109910 [Babesia bigemina]|uniref:Uncharacterized protein n=1 Tax=Babesia bigemina TaxID=5866 RepID=A0A061D243_BABBI|nr:hypothetical protein BBBOND_0109910 [Babesia bigemina]CDR94693.1 hypothetical protein BBBOND_0109910 [Babesia bigemina]|eukprot:XP_012766879.1 hypothetical protein BBBOND_0109910 [Babesia bigemina]